MATTLFLIRHAAHDLVGRVLCGRMPGVHLGERGRAEAAALARRLAGEGLAAVYAGPLPRAQETAEPIARRAGLVLETEAALDEIDFGAWTGRSLAALDGDPDWRRWNDEREAARPPGGESMQEAQGRMLRWLEAVPRRHPGAAIAAVSHADVIKAALAGLLGLPLGRHDRFEIGPAGISTVLLWPDGGAKVLRVNEATAGA